MRLTSEDLVRLKQKAGYGIASDTRRSVEPVRIDRDDVKTIDSEVKVKKRLRQSSKPVLNALESRFLTKLQDEHPGSLILAQAVRLELARGIWYKADFYVPVSWLGGPVFFEVKGPKVFRGGLENLKVAARVHAWATFILVWEDTAAPGSWAQQIVLP